LKSVKKEKRKDKKPLCNERNDTTGGDRKRMGEREGRPKKIRTLLRTST